MDIQTTTEALKALKYACVDFDKIAKTCNRKDVDLAHIQVMAENGAKTAKQMHDHVLEIANAQANTGL